MKIVASKRVPLCTKFLCLLLGPLMLAPGVGEAQEVTTLDPGTRQTMQAAAAQGFRLPTSINVSGLTGISAVAASAAPQKPGGAPGGNKGKAVPQADAVPSQTVPGAPSAANSGKNTASGQTPNPAPSETGTVAQNVSVESVLIPYDVCRRVFGRQVAQNYAVIELTISNRSSNASLIVHSIFIDYSQWALSGSMYLGNGNIVASTQQPDSKGSSNPPVTQPNPNYPNYQTPNNANQVASAEYRVVRGGLLDAQPWTARNIAIRALTLAGAIASAYSFSISEQGIIRGIAAFSGQVVPGAETFWPDGTVGQMNRISDLGFQVNKVIPKNSSDIVVAFFPIDRFLTPGLKKIYLKAPALFFAPYALVLDRDARAELAPIVAEFMPTPSPAPENESVKNAKLKEAQAFLSHLALQYMEDVVAQSENPSAPGFAPDHTLCSSFSDTAFDGQNPLSERRTCVVKKFLAHASLNTVRVVVGGDMTVNVDNIPATITSVDMDGGNDSEKVWGQTGEVTGTIHGTYLAGGKVSIAEKSDLGIPGDPETVAENSTDAVLHFKMTLSKPISSGKTLTFTVSKQDKSGNTVQSLPYVLAVDYTGTPTVTGAQLKDSSLTVSGINFSDTTAAPLTMLLYSQAGKTKTLRYSLTNSSLAVPNSAEVDIDLSKAKDESAKPPAAISLDAGCWTVGAKIGDTAMSGEAPFAKPPSPKITSAPTLGTNGKTITVTGEGFLDLRDCHAPLTFQLIDEAGKRHEPSGLKLTSESEATFDCPKEATTGKIWKVVVGVGTEPSSTPTAIPACATTPAK